MRTINVEQIEQRIAELRASTMELVAQSIGDNTVGQNEARLKACRMRLNPSMTSLCGTGNKMAQKRRYEQPISLKVRKLNKAS